MENIIHMQDIVKIFPPNVIALDQVTVDFKAGEIHAIVGENGAGKSTLMKILFGLEPRSAGQVELRGQPVTFHAAGDAIRAGIGMVHQEILLINEYTIWENIVLGVEPTRLFGHMDRTQARQKVQQKIDEFHFNLNPDAKIADISIAARQKVEILKLLYRNVEVLILDEPTAVLTPQEIPQFFNELRQLRDAGKTILFISHHLEEVLSLSDRITVMRKGKKVDTVNTAETNKTDLARMMVGRDVVFLNQRHEVPQGKLVFDLQGLSVQDANKLPRLKDVSIQVRAGEIVGIAGVEGNGQLDLVNAIMGITAPTRGRMLVNTTDLTYADILQRRRLISFVSQDRGGAGSAGKVSITENMMMTHHRLNPGFTFWKGLLLNSTFARQFTASMQQLFSISMGSSSDPFKSLSGGNQQKVILARELTLQTPFLLLDQPTRGLDVGSIEYVHENILRLRDEQRAVLLISADLEELFRLADRILVINRGRIVANLPISEATVERVGYLMLEAPADHIEGKESHAEENH